MLKYEVTDPCPVHKACVRRNQKVADCEAGVYMAVTHNGLVRSATPPHDGGGTIQLIKHGERGYIRLATCIAVAIVVVMAAVVAVKPDTNRVAFTAADHAAIAQGQQAELAQVQADEARIAAERARIAAEQAAAAERARRAAIAAQRAARAKAAPRPVVASGRAVNRPAVGDDIWRALANCESALGNDSKNGKYHGYFQFSLATWQGIGGTGDPHTYPYEYQKMMAQRLQARSGWGQWPVCSRKLGLR